MSSNLDSDLDSDLDSNLLLNNKLMYDYTEIITNFLTKITNLSFIPNDTEYDCMLYIGINIIHRVYEYVLFKLENLKSSQYYSQKAYVYFIEYMEQMYMNGLSQHINHNEAILFIYKKTIFELHNETMDTMTNIITLNNDIFNKQCIKYIKNIFIFTNCLFYWNNSLITTSNRICICNKYLLSFIQNINIDNILLTIEYLEFIRNKNQLRYDTYCLLLDEICNLYKSHTTIPKITNINDHLLIKFYIDDTYLYDKIKENNMKDLVHWLYIE